MSRISVIMAGLLLIFLASCDQNSGSTTDPDDNDAYRTATVTFVYDGDTIQVDGGERVRYTGIDTPEIGECYYNEARLRNTQLVGGKQVQLEVCEESPQDPYGRTLAHVHQNGALINALLLEEGYAESFRVPPCTDRADYYDDLERRARNESKGRWGACN